MNDDDRQLAEALRRSAPESSGVPEFDEVFGHAEAELERRKRRKILGAAGAVASVAAVAVVLMLSSPDELPQPEPLQITGLLDSTSWVAPSDVLLPEHEFDIFEELPEPMESTDSAEGALL